MQPLHDLYTQNKVAIINAVGVPGNAQGLFDHAAGQYEFHRATFNTIPPRNRVDG